MTGGQALAESLRALGVRHVFGIPGVQLDPAVDGLYGVRDDVTFVCARNEQAATYMADGYARSSGRIGVAMVVPGPGVLNALAGLATAYACSSPVLLLAGQIRSTSVGRRFGELHELPDQSSILASLTKWSVMASDPAQIPDLVAQAVRELRSGRPRPVAIELPPDVLAARADVDTSLGPDDGRYRAPLALDAGAVSRAARVLTDAERPVIYAGSGVSTTVAQEALTELAERLDAPVVVSENGRGAIDARHPLALDAVAMRELRVKADVVLAVGTRFMILDRPVPTGAARLITMNVDPADLGDPRPTEIAIQADAQVGLRALNAEVAYGDRVEGTAWAAEVRAWCRQEFRPLAPQLAYLDVIREALGEDGVLVNELTQVGYVAGQAFPTYSPRTFLTPGYQGTLGYGFATGLGVKVANPHRRVISISGDGGFGWTLPELSTARAHAIGLVTIVFNDGFFGNVRRIQSEQYGGRHLATELTNPDYATLAEAFDIGYARAADPGELRSVLARVFGDGAHGPVLVDAPVGEFPSPWNLIFE